MTASNEGCRGFGSVRSGDIEKAIVRALLHHLETSELAEAHARAVEAQIAAAESEARAQCQKLASELTTLEGRFDQSIDSQERGELDQFPADMIIEDRRKLSERIEMIKIELGAVRARAKSEDDITPVSLKMGLNYLLKNGAFDEAGSRADSLRRAFYQVVRRVSLLPSDDVSQVRATIRFDFGPLIAQDSVDRDASRYVEEVVDIPRADTAPTKRGRRPPVLKDFRTTQGLRDHEWLDLDRRMLHVAPTIQALGWEARPLMEGARLCALTGWGKEQRDWLAEQGPLDTFPAAVRAFIKSGAYAAVVDGLADTPFGILSPEALMPGVPRPSSDDIIARVHLTRDSTTDGEQQRRTIVAAVLDGVPPFDVAKAHAIPLSAVDELVVRYRAYGHVALDAFKIFDVKVDTPGVSDVLKGALRDIRSPLIETRLHIALLSLQGCSVPAIAAESGWTAKDVRKWIGRFQEEGVVGLWSRGWQLRGMPIQVSARAYKNAEALRKLASTMPKDRRASVEAVACWCSGESTPTILAALNGTEDDFDRPLRTYQAYGLPGLAAWQVAASRDREEAERITNSAASMRDADAEADMQVLSAFVGGLSIAQTASKFCLSVVHVQTLVRLWEQTGSVSVSVCGPDGRLSRAQLDILGKVVADGKDPWNPNKRVNWVVLTRFCLEHFGLKLRRSTVTRSCVEHGISIPWGKNDQPATFDGEH